MKKNSISKELGEIFGVKRWLEYLESDNNQKKKVQLSFDQKDFKPYAEYVNIPRYYHGEQILKNAKDAFHWCVKNQVGRQEAKNMVEFMENQLMKSAFTEEKRPKNGDSGVDMG